jgi:hypothetical protein
MSSPSVVARRFAYEQCIDALDQGFSGVLVEGNFFLLRRAARNGRFSFSGEQPWNLARISMQRVSPLLFDAVFILSSSPPHQSEIWLVELPFSMSKKITRPLS